MNSDGHVQCMDCHVMKAGPLTGQNPGYKVGTITTGEQGEPVFHSEPETKELGLGFDMSHGICQDCYDTRMAPYQERIAEMERQRQEAEAAEARKRQGRMKRGKRGQPT